MGGAGRTLAVVATFLAGAAEAQVPHALSRTDQEVQRDCRAEAIAARGGTLLGKRPYAVFWQHGALARDCLIISFVDATPKRDAPPVLLASRQHTSLMGATRRTWADSRVCDGAIEAARALETFRPVGIKLRAINPSDSLRVDVDGWELGLWSSEGRGDPASARSFPVDVEGSNYPGLYEMGRKMNAALDKCLTAKASK